MREEPVALCLGVLTPLFQTTSVMSEKAHGQAGVSSGQRTKRGTRKEQEKTKTRRGSTREKRREPPPSQPRGPTPRGQATKAKGGHKTARQTRQKAAKQKKSTRKAGQHARLRQAKEARKKRPGHLLTKSAPRICLNLFHLRIPLNTITLFRQQFVRVKSLFHRLHSIEAHTAFQKDLSVNVYFLLRRYSDRNEISRDHSTS